MTEINTGHSMSTSLKKGGGDGVRPRSDGHSPKIFLYLYFSNSILPSLYLMWFWQLFKEKQKNKNSTPKMLFVPLRYLYHQLHRILILPLCQHGLFIHVCLCVKMTALVDLKTQFSDLYCFFWNKMACLSLFP